MEVYRVLVACEYSGRVRKACEQVLEEKGINHYVVSCDLLPSDMPEGKHYQGDVRDIAYDKWDIIIAHPPCTHLASSGARWWDEKQEEQREAIAFAKWFMTLPCPKIAIENPIGILSRKENLGKPSQIIQPWQYGHGETKATCLWLKGLPLLQPTNIVDGRNTRIHRMPDTKDRWKKRSITYEGIAQAFAKQWL